LLDAGCIENRVERLAGPFFYDSEPKRSWSTGTAEDDCHSFSREIMFLRSGITPTASGLTLNGGTVGLVDRERSADGCRTGYRGCFIFRPAVCADPDRSECVASPAALLHDVREFVREQFLSFAEVRCILSRAKHDMAPNGVPQCIDRPRRLRGLWVRVNADLAEVVSEARLEEGPRLRVQRLARRAQNIVDDRWSDGGMRAFCCVALQGFLLLAFGALTGGPARSAASALPLQGSERRTLQQLRFRRCAGLDWGFRPHLFHLLSSCPTIFP
jgi:hypothetical protein